MVITAVGIISVVIIALAIVAVVIVAVGITAVVSIAVVTTVGAWPQEHGHKNIGAPKRKAHKNSLLKRRP